jgi:cell division protein FtsN
MGGIGVGVGALLSLLAVLVYALRRRAERRQQLAALKQRQQQKQQQRQQQRQLQQKQQKQQKQQRQQQQSGGAGAEAATAPSREERPALDLEALQPAALGALLPAASRKLGKLGSSSPLSPSPRSRSSAPIARELPAAGAAAGAAAEQLTENPLRRLPADSKKKAVSFV